MKNQPPLLLICTILALSASAACAQNPAGAAPSQPEQAPEQLEAVSVSGLKRDSSILPYGRMNTVLSGLQRYGNGLFRMDFYIEPKDGQAAPLTPKLAVQHAERYIPIVFKPDGSFELPVLPQAQADEADLASNLPKGSTGLRGTINLTTRPEDLDMATVRRLMATAHQLRNELLPWYARWLFPQIEGVRICSAQPQWNLEWPAPGAALPNNAQVLSVPLTVDPKERDPNEFIGKKRPAEGSVARMPCTVLSGQEAWPDKARLIAPAGTRLSIRLSSNQ